jgi:hypothetical protein
MLICGMPFEPKEMACAPPRNLLSAFENTKNAAGDYPDTVPVSEDHMRAILCSFGDAQIDESPASSQLAPVATESAPPPVGGTATPLTAQAMIAMLGEVIWVHPSYLMYTC